jgi:hypothetical protein
MSLNMSIESQVYATPRCGRRDLTAMNEDCIHSFILGGMGFDLLGRNPAGIEFTMRGFCFARDSFPYPRTHVNSDDL